MRESVDVPAVRTCRADTRSPDRRGADRSRFALVRYAVGKLLDRKPATGGFRQGPLCVVSPGGSSSLLADLADLIQAEDRPCFATDGPSLGQEMDAAAERDCWNRLRGRFCRPQVVIVQRFEQIGGRNRQAAFRQLFDAAEAADWCLGLGSHPHAGPLEPDLAARLAAGLVVTLSGEAAKPSGHSPTITRIVSATARQFGIATATLTGSGRSRTVARARSLAMFLARRLTSLSYEAIGRGVGGRDHTTAMLAARVTAVRLAADDSLAADAEAIIAGLAPRARGRRRKGFSTAPQDDVGRMSVACRDDERS